MAKKSAKSKEERTVESDAAAEADGGQSVYKLIRLDIVEGRLEAGTRLNVSQLARRYGSSSNPVREALQQLRGEGFVQFTHNRGARVRPIDEDFMRNMYEITALLEPYMLRWFVDNATDADIARLEEIQADIESTGLDDPTAYGPLDDAFHAVLNGAHYNPIAIDIWHHRRETLRAVSLKIPIGRMRREAIIRQHRGIIDCVRRHDVEAASALIVEHINGAAEHVFQNLRAERAASAPRPIIA